MTSGPSRLESNWFHVIKENELVRLTDQSRITKIPMSERVLLLLNSLKEFQNR